MDELLRSFYADNPAGAPDAASEISPYPGHPPGEDDGDGGLADVGVGRGELLLSRRADRSGCKEAVFGEMTLEAFLASGGTVGAEEDVGAAAPGAVPQQLDRPMLGFLVDPALEDRFVQPHPQLLQVDASHARFGDGVDGGKKRAAQDPLNKVSQQKQRRMIKNRESAARSRERKEAYTSDLEKLVTKLEEENAMLVRQQEEQNKSRLKQLMENLIPVDERKRSPPRLRRTCSTHW
uniref:G-box-binding factor 4 n=1 Tax=Anthurium amnicola TaxID=1678845 RepID=A0A1D1Z798_9ARAE